MSEDVRKLQRDLRDGALHPTPPRSPAPKSSAAETSSITVALPPDFLEAVAVRVAAILDERLPAAEPVSPYMTIPEAAEYLRCSRQRIDDLLSQRRLSRVKEGARTLVLRSEIEQHLQHERRR